jgi:hypothetical protein
MKKLFIAAFLLSLVSCMPAPTVVPTSTPIASAVIAPSAVPTVTATAIFPQATQTEPIQNIVQREYDPSEWKLLSDKSMVWKVVVGPAQKIWILLERAGGEVAFFDGGKWVVFSNQDYGMDGFSDMAIASDGVVWVSGRDAISRYKNGRWDVFPMPHASKTASPRLAIAPSGVVWVALPGCFCGDSIRVFDGKKWEEPYEIGQGTAYQFLFTPDGTPWAVFYTVINRRIGQTWKPYLRKDLLLPPVIRGEAYPDPVMRIASDIHGNIFGIYEGQTEIVKIGPDDHVSKIPFDFSNLSLDSMRLRLFIDRQDTIWVNTRLNRNKSNACLAYYKDNQWVSFVNLPFGAVNDFNELPDGTLLVATSQGLYQFKSAK